MHQVYEQMSLAVDREATRIWVVNVGDMKPLEMDIGQTAVFRMRRSSNHFS